MRLANRACVGLLVMGWLIVSVSHAAPTRPLKDFKEIRAALVQFLGEGTMPADVQKVYLTLEPSLPQTGSLSEFTMASVSSISSLVGTACQYAIKRDKGVADPLKRITHQGIEFGKGLSGLNANAFTTTTTEYAERFWGRAANGDELKTLQNAWNQILAEVQKGSKNLDEFLVTYCVIAGTSLSFFTY